VIWILTIVSGLLVVFVMLLTMTFALHVIIGVPYVPTSWRVAAEMVRAASLRGDEVVYDLGAGDGRLLIAAKRRHPGIKACGWEIVPTVLWLGKLQIWLRKADVSLRLGNALTQDMRDADVIFLYLMPHVLAKLESKFDAELRPGTKVISNTFRFPSKQATQEVVLSGGRKKILVYEW